MAKKPKQIINKVVSSGSLVRLRGNTPERQANLGVVGPISEGPNLPGLCRVYWFNGANNKGNAMLSSVQELEVLEDGESMTAERAGEVSLMVAARPGQKEEYEFFEMPKRGGQTWEAYQLEFQEFLKTCKKI